MLFRPTPRILHVVESLGGGVVSSVLAMVDATPDLDHHLAFWPWRDHADTGDELAVFRSVHTLSTKPVRAVLDLRDLVHGLRPGRVHAHSSYAGLLARAVDLDVDVVYSPHCFAYERRDLGPAGRLALRQVERALVRRTAVLVACSPREAMLAEALGHREVVLVPNRALDPPAVRARHAEELRVVAVGRVSAQKDWRHLLAVKDRVEREHGRPITWEWLGGGDPDGEHALRDHGVAVAGWLPRGEVLRRLGDAQAYLHTAAWEAAPISIIEAASVGLPIAARGIGTLVSLGVPGVAATVGDLADRLVALHDPAVWVTEQQRSLTFAARHSADVQRERLNAAYRHAPARLALR